MMEANPSLGYRDVQLILAYSARQIANETNTWKFNGAKNINGGGLHYDAVTHNLGFGMVDALAAVRLAESWKGAPLTSQNVIEVSASVAQPKNIPDGSSLVSQSVRIDQNILVERVELKVDIAHSYIGDLGILLTSPSGTDSWLIYKAGESSESPYGLSQNNINFTFNTVLSMGERSIGSWSLAVFDLNTGDVGTLNSWSINLIGRNNSGDDTYFYSDEYSDTLQKDESRSILTDSEGTDLLNAAMVTLDLRIDLNPGSVSTIDANKLTINSFTQIENAIGGDGNDFIQGNISANSIEGMRGNDTLLGGGGNDLLTGGVGDDSIDGGDGVDTLIVSGTSLNYTIRYNSATQKYSIEATTGTDGKDTFSNVEYISYSDKAVLLTSIDFKPPNSPIIGTEVSETFKTLIGDDSINGGGGIDTVVVSAGIDNYSVTKTATGYTLVDKNGADGTDSLINIERIQFKDKTLALDIGPGQNAGQVYRLYQAAFARTPDTPGVKYHLNDMEANGLALWNISSNFLASPEFSAKYGSNPTDTQYITALYKNVLNRTPAASEVAWYKDQFDSKKMDHQAALIGFSESPENVALVGVAISNGILLG